MKHLLLFLTLLLALPAMAQRPVIEIDVYEADADDGLVGLLELDTSKIALNTTARVKGTAEIGDGGAANYRWTGAAWEAFTAPAGELDLAAIAADGFLKDATATSAGFLKDDTAVGAGFLKAAGIDALIPLTRTGTSAVSAGIKANLALQWPEAVADGGVSLVDVAADGFLKDATATSAGFLKDATATSAGFLKAADVTPLLPTVSSLGLDNVDNTADLDKPISTATTTAISALDDRYAVTKIMRGPGIDPTGANDSTAAINAFFDANKNLGARIIIPQGTYLISDTIVLYSGTCYQGEVAFTDYNGVTRFKANNDPETGWTTGGTGYTPSYKPMFKTANWDTTPATGWMHALTIHDICIDGNFVAEVGICLHRLGEVSGLYDCLIDRCTQKGVWATGNHAPFHMENCTINRGVDGIHFDIHPLGSVDGGGSGGCSARIFGLSGDISTEAFVRISGSQQVTIVGIKSEQHAGSTILIDGAGSSGSAASLTLVGGYSNDVTTASELIKIAGTAKPSIMLLGFETPQSGSVPMIRDTSFSPERTVPINRGTAGRSGLVTYGSGRSYLGQDITLPFGHQIFGTSNAGVTHTMLSYSGAEQQVILKAGAHPGGIELRDVAGAVKFKINTTGVGFNGSGPIAKPSITSRRGSEAWFNQINAFLTNYGLFSDFSSSSYDGLILGQTTVAGLPNATIGAINRMRLEVSDALLPVVNSTVAGGGAVVAEVRSNGTNWVVTKLINDDGLRLGISSVAGLPAAASANRMRREVTDADTPVIGSAVVGGGSDTATVRSDGTNWVVIELF